MEREKAYSLWRALHACPELSGKEVKTKRLLRDFILENTEMTVHACGDGFYAAHREPEPKQSGIVLRADYDAVARADGSAEHLCGHDGHAAALCLAALELRGRAVGRNVFFLFQPAEETGAGAAPCCEIFSREEISEIYGVHNLPGYQAGQVFTRFGTFACGSLGLTVRFAGKPAHAAYPEAGISPAPAVAELLSAAQRFSAAGEYAGMTLCTVIGVAMGEKAFGAAAENAELWLTLRAEREADLKKLLAAVSEQAALLAEKYGLGLELRQQDVFPATENHAECVRRAIDRCGARMLDAPMRWSEDFGHYLQHCKGAFLGIGAGLSQPELHTEQYVFPAELLEPTARALVALI